MVVGIRRLIQVAVALSIYQVHLVAQHQNRATQFQITVAVGIIAVIDPLRSDDRVIANLVRSIVAV
ncbi:hypothetical protein CR157_16325 [Halomonas sp. LBP4]|nr:hypothetical protein CR157_16325 [Halomonas sp. LBP4]